MLRVGVLGAAGRMGATVCQAVFAASDTELVAAVDPGAAGTHLARTGGAAGEGGGIVLSGAIESLAEAGAEVAVDFTNAAAALANMRYCAAAGIHVVSGTSGLTGTDIDELRSLFQAGSGDGGPGSANCIWAPNFAIGAVVMMRLAEIAAGHLDAVEVIELHHDGKRDAPSGTAIETARRMTLARRASGRGDWPPDHTTVETVHGARGANTEGDVRVHSVRLPGLVAHQEVIFGAPGQTVTIRHDSYDRVSFMPGVMMAVRQVPTRPGLTVGLGELLGL